jgi:hypothetical protein
MDNQARTRTKSKKPPARPELEPISYEEIMANAGMSGFVSFLDAPDPPVASKPADPPDAPVVTPSDTVPTPNTVEDTVTVQQRKLSTVHESTSVQKLSTVQVTPSDTVPTPDTVEDTATVQQRKSTTVDKSISAQETSTVQIKPIQDSRRWKVKRAHGVEDGHSLAEQEVYRTLWKVGAPEGDDPEANRTIRIGYDRLAGLVRLSWVTVKANLRSLEKKLAIEVVAAEDSANREGKQYRVYSTSTILERRQSAGLLWVRRTRGVELLTDASGAAPVERVAPS